MNLRQLSSFALFSLAGLATHSALAAAPCETTLEATDAMTFTKSSIEVPKGCKQFSVKLSHTGKMPRTAMGHNWVLSKTADMQGVVADGMAAGADKQYVKAGDTRVIAHTKLIGGGESDAVSFDVSKLKAVEAYSFFCSFPGHSALMKGTLQVAK